VISLQEIFFYEGLFLVFLGILTPAKGVTTICFPLEKPASLTDYQWF